MQKLPKTPEKSGQSPQNNRAQREKISCRAKQDPRKEEQPELPLPHIERNAEQRQKKQQQKRRVQHKNKAGQGVVEQAYQPDAPRMST